LRLHVFYDYTADAEAHRRLYLVDIDRTCQQHHTAVELLVIHGLQDRQPIAPRHAEIEEQDIGLVLANCL
jgi:hypothetical protein